METKKCPICGEEIPAKAKKCKYCKEWIGGPDEGQAEVGAPQQPVQPQQPVAPAPQQPRQQPVVVVPPPAPYPPVPDDDDDDDDDYVYEGEKRGFWGSVGHFFGNLIYPSRGKAFWISICSLLAVILVVVLLLLFGGDIKDSIEDFTDKAQSSATHKSRRSDRKHHRRDYSSSRSRNNTADEDEIVEDEGDYAAQLRSESSYIDQGYYVGSGSIGKYPVKMRLAISDDGSVTGKYAYESTLNKYGDVESSWIGLKGSYGDNQTMQLEYDQYYTDKNNDEMTFRFTPDGYTLTLDGTIFLNPPSGASKTMPMQVTLDKK